MALEFVLGVRESTLLGSYLTAYLIDLSGTEYYKVIGNIIKDDVDRELRTFTDVQKKIVKLTDEYSDNNLVKAFSRNKKISVSEFYANLETDFAETRIKPYIERRNVQIIEIALQNQIRLFHKVDRFENLYNEDEIKIEKNPAEAVFNFIRTETETRYFLTVLHNETEINLTNKVGITLSTDPCRIVLNNALYYFSDIDAKKLQPFFTKAFIPVAKRTEKKYYETFVLNAIKNFKVKNTGFDIINVGVEKTAILSLEKNWKNEFVLILKFRYNDIDFLANSKTNTIVKFDDISEEFFFSKLDRDYLWENNIKEILNSFKLIIENETNYKINILNPVSELQQLATINWLNENSKKIEEAGIKIIQITTDKKYFTGTVSLDFKVSSKKDWFDIYAVVAFDEFSFPFVILKDLIKRGERLFELPNGIIAVLPEEWFSKYGSLILMNQGKGEQIALKKIHFSLIQETFGNFSDKSEISSLIETFSNIDKLELELPQTINATLRDYQKRGFAWLYALQKNNFGGCLADDMGLGKTLQTISLLVKSIDDLKCNEKLILENENNVASLTSLIVMPKSLIHNWYNEFSKFAPHLKILKYSGSSRKVLENVLTDYDVVLSSYGVVRNDFEILAKTNFLYIVLDESQYIKNPDSKIYNALLKLNSQFKIILTGTPIENSLQDLWSQLNFVNNGLLGSLSFFKENFIDEIEKNKNKQTIEKLQKIILPFILRRTKSEVAKDLPSLTEQVIYCEMSEEQRKLYEEEKSKIRNKMLELIDLNLTRKSGIWIIKAMSQLRQLANHPKMIGHSDLESGKFEEAKEIIETLISENHKVLIFSSFVKHLKIFEEYFIEKNINYSLLTGASAKREEIINEFQNNEQNKIFLISVKAGGVGLNLTSADYVIILDPWWNPAVENQAISRAHRIGQDKKVMVYRFISKDTIEEKILKLQSDKLNLADAFVNSNNPLKLLSDQTILDFFE